MAEDVVTLYAHDRLSPQQYVDSCNNIPVLNRTQHTETTPTTPAFTVPTNGKVRSHDRSFSVHACALAPFLRPTHSSQPLAATPSVKLRLVVAVLLYPRRLSLRLQGATSRPLIAPKEVERHFDCSSDSDSACTLAIPSSVLALSVSRYWRRSKTPSPSPNGITTAHPRTTHSVTSTSA